MGYNYFIEDLDTGKWYRDTIGLHPKIHTFGKGWDKPPLLKEDYWTSDPLEAFDFFTDSAAVEYINWACKRVGVNGQFTESIAFAGDQLGRIKQVMVTEHEFIVPCL